MIVQSIMLIGGPDSGKTNYSSSLCKTLLKSGNCKLTASSLPDDIAYIEELLAHNLQGSFAPRSNPNLDESPGDYTIPIALAETPDIPLTKIVVPDVTGELWKKAVETTELSSEWMEQLEQSSGALIFVRVLSDQNFAPLDWVTSSRLLKLVDNDEEQGEIPTQVFLSELLRFIECTLKPANDGSPPRVSVLVTAWDKLDEQTSKTGPSAYLKAEYPLFAGRLKDTNKLDVRVFGVSSFGGDLENDKDFRAKFMDGKLNNAGYIVTETEDEIIKNYDLTLPLDWLIRR